MLLVVVPLALSLLAPSRIATPQATQSCDRVATTTLVFGRDGGNIRPFVVTIAPDGAVVDSSAGTSGTIPVAAVKALAKRAWAKSFSGLRTAAPSHAPLKDESLAFIEVRSACGTHRVERPLSLAPRAFRDLYRRLERARDDALHARTGS